MFSLHLSSDMTTSPAGLLLSNVKCHFRISSTIDLQKKVRSVLAARDNKCQQQWVQRLNTTLAVVKIHNIVFLIYFKARIVNATGLTNFESAPHQARDCFQAAFNLSPQSIGKPVIDNSTAHGKLEHRIHLQQSQEALLQHCHSPLVKIHCIRYNPHHFAGLYIKTNLCTIHVFSTGSFVILGAKRWTDIVCVHQTLLCNVFNGKTKTL